MAFLFFFFLDAADAPFIVDLADAGSGRRRGTPEAGGELRHAHGVGSAAHQQEGVPGRDADADPPLLLLASNQQDLIFLLHLHLADDDARLVLLFVVVLHVPALHHEPHLRLPGLVGGPDGGALPDVVLLLLDRQEAPRDGGAAEPAAAGRGAAALLVSRGTGARRAPTTLPGRRAEGAAAAGAEGLERLADVDRDLVDPALVLGAGVEGGVPVVRPAAEAGLGAGQAAAAPGARAQRGGGGGGGVLGLALAALDPDLADAGDLGRGGLGGLHPAPPAPAPRRRARREHGRLAALEAPAVPQPPAQRRAQQRGRRRVGSAARTSSARSSGAGGGAAGAESLGGCGGAEAGGGGAGGEADEELGAAAAAAASAVQVLLAAHQAREGAAQGEMREPSL
uniref:Uncharacterized protein n=1 Tax=Triticum urartu TaxID=4572 RepID=A0A8R7P706_TRIUA